MNPVWTITYLGTEKSAADWGLNAQPRIRTRDRSPTRFSFQLAGYTLETAVPFPFRAEVIIKQNRVLSGGGWSGTGAVFTLYQTTQHGRADGQTNSVWLDFEDALWLFANTTFQQEWKINTLTLGSVVTSSRLISRCVLFMDINAWVPNTYQSIKWQIEQIVDWAAACGINIAAGTIELDAWYLNYYHCRAISIWDALLKCLEPVPDAKVWIDGSTTPPTLNVRTRSSIAALASPATTGPGPVTLAYRGIDSAGRRHISSELTPRYDLIPPQVVIQYQTNNTVNGTPAPTTTNDVYPPGSDGKMPFAMVVPIDLTGAVITTQTGRLDCEALACVGGTHAQKRAWWASKRGGEQAKLEDLRVRFQDTTGAATTIGDATVIDDATGAAVNLANFPRRLVDGTFQPWMRFSGADINCVRARVSVIVQFAHYDVVGASETATNGNVIRKSTRAELHCEITLTNAPTGITDFNSSELEEEAETPVANLAQNIYNSRAQLDYDGSHEIVDVGTAANPPLAQILGHWNVLNLSGGAAAWAAANMTIAGTEIDLQTNHQRIDIGPAKHLSPQDWNEMLQFFRNRRQFISSSTRATGYGGAGGEVLGARNTPAGNTVPGLNVDSQQVAIHYTTENDPTTPVRGMINADAKIVYVVLAAAAAIPTGTDAEMRKLQPREIELCEVGGVRQYMLVMGGEPYTKP